MATFLSDEWFALVRSLGGELPAVEGASLVVQHIVSGGPQGKGKLHAVVELSDGRIATAELAKRADAPCTCTWAYDDAAAAVMGKASVDELFMRGDLKVEGDYVTLLLELRPVLASEPWRRFLDALRRSTEL